MTLQCKYGIEFQFQFPERLNSLLKREFFDKAFQTFPVDYMIFLILIFWIFFKIENFKTCRKSFRGSFYLFVA